MNEIEQKQMDIRIDLSPNLFKCVECKSTIMFEPSSKVDYKQKDEQGNVLTKQSAENMAKYRVRCSNCSANFCTQCKRKPYYLGHTCEEAENFAGARKCRFCTVEIKKAYNHPKKAF